MEFLTFLGVLGLLFWVSSLNGRIKRLEGGTQIKASSQAPSFVSPPVPGEVQKPASLLQTKVSVEGLSQKFVTWIKEDWLMKLGALLLLIGFGWFATYAFLNNWIGPAGRISLGLGLGADSDTRFVAYPKISPSGWGVSGFGFNHYFIDDIRGAGNL